MYWYFTNNIHNSIHLAKNNNNDQSEINVQSLSNPSQSQLSKPNVEDTESISSYKRKQQYPQTKTNKKRKISIQTELNTITAETIDEILKVIFTSTYKQFHLIYQPPQTIASAINSIMRFSKFYDLLNDQRIIIFVTYKTLRNIRDTKKPFYVRAMGNWMFGDANKSLFFVQEGDATLFSKLSQNSYTKINRIVVESMDLFIRLKASLQPFVNKQIIILDDGDTNDNIKLTIYKDIFNDTFEPVLPSPQVHDNTGLLNNILSYLFIASFI